MSGRIGSRGPAPKPLAARLSSKVTLAENGCWLWTGATGRDGYGQLSVGSTADGSATRRQAHRLVWELVVGPVPNGLQLDHLCRNRACVNPAHLEPVTQAENVRRAFDVPTCWRGHLWSEHAYIRPGGTRECRECRRLRDRQEEEDGYSVALPPRKEVA